jgi:TonB-linked SusC/RagA family outer membrane protein
MKNKKQIKKTGRKRIFFPKRLFFACILIIGINLPAISQIKVAGTVSDNTGETMPGVSVSIKGATIGAYTDEKGEFSLTAPGDTSVLIFSCIGYKTQEIQIGNRRVLAVTMHEDVAQLGEVTVVAFGKQKKESVLASISTVNPEELKVPSSNLTTALAGRMAGIISYQRSGEPGLDNADFFIRGVTTFGYKKDPLILIDGIELTSSDLARMQVDDISSFSIMKDATATALYGARGANGVILVTTKEGQEGKAKVSIRVENSISSPTTSVKLADPVTYMKMNNEAVKTRDPLGASPHSLQKIAYTEQGVNPYVYPAVDWYNMLFRETTINRRINANISGGGPIARYYIAGTYNVDNGNLKVDKRNNFNNNISVSKYVLRSNVNVNVTKTTEAIVRLHGTMDDYTGPIDGGSNVYKKVMQTSPVDYPPYFLPDDSHQYAEYILFGNYDNGRYINPYADMTKGYRETKTSLMLAQFELKQKLDFITQGLNIRALFNTNRRQEYGIRRSYTPYYFSIGSYDPQKDKYTLAPLNNNGTDYLTTAVDAKDIYTTTYFESALNYDRVFNDTHSVSGLLVFIMRDYLSSLNSGNLQQSLPQRNMGLSGRFTYSYDSRYFTEFNFGYNGSERFSNSERYGFFPSAGLGWMVSNEPFWNEALKSKISKLKFKATYGLVGNDAIGDEDSRFFYLSEVNLNSSTYAYTWGQMFSQTQNGVVITRYANPSITWETSRKTNLGVELGLFDKTEVQIDVYRDYRYNILMDRVSIPGTMGLQADIQANIGEAISSGIDLSLDYNLSVNKDLWVTTRGNFTYATNEFKVYEEPDYSVVAPWRSRIGYSINQQWGYVAERLFVDDAEVHNSPTQTFGEYRGGDIKYVDINGDSQITAMDQVPIGYPTSPEIVYGFGFSSGYKEFDLSCFFQGLARESFWIDTKATAPFINTGDFDGLTGKNQALQVYADSYWSEENRDLYALWPRLSTTIINNNNQRSTWFMRDGSFLRLKTLELGYTLPDKWIRKLGMTSFRLYYSGVNLLCFSRFKLWDPEMAGNGLGYPIQRVHNIGINLSF